MIRVWTTFQFNKENVPVLRRDLGRIKVSLSAWIRAHKGSIRAALVPGRGASKEKKRLCKPYPAACIKERPPN
eukprot:746587-Pelagomonas_calceolata.AAC.1